MKLPENYIEKMRNISPKIQHLLIEFFEFNHVRPDEAILAMSELILSMSRSGNMSAEELDIFLRSLGEQYKRG
jgi:hypothetical protein